MSKNDIISDQSRYFRRMIIESRQQTDEGVAGSGGDLGDTLAKVAGGALLGGAGYLGAKAAIGTAKGIGRASGITDWNERRKRIKEMEKAEREERLSKEAREKKEKIDKHGKLGLASYQLGSLIRKAAHARHGIGTRDKTPEEKKREEQEKKKREEQEKKKRERLSRVPSSATAPPSGLPSHMPMGMGMNVMEDLNERLKATIQRYKEHGENS